MMPDKIKKAVRLFLYCTYIIALIGALFYLLTIRYTGSEVDTIVVYVLTGFLSGGAVMMSVYAFSLYMRRLRNRYMLLFGLYCLSTALRVLVLEGGPIRILLPAMSMQTVLLLRSVLTNAAGLSNFYLILELFGRRHVRLLQIAGTVWLLIPMIISNAFSFTGTPIDGVLGLIGGVPVLLAGMIVVLRSGQMRDGITRLYAAATVFSLFSYSMIMLGVPSFALVWNFLFLVINALLMSDRYAESQRREEALAERNALLDGLNRTKTEFLQDMSHEMKAPLTIIATGIDFADREIGKEGGDLAEAREALDTIREETQRLGRMVSGMISLAAMSGIAENRRRVDFAALLENSAEAFRRQMEKWGNALLVQIAPGLPDVFVEHDRFTQVMTNLLFNAADHTQDGQVRITAERTDGLITVQVTDTGDGIEPELLPTVLERGVSGRGGTGYGLFICKTIVEAHGGTIKVESEPGEGTAVTFTVPVYAGQEAIHRS